MTSRRHSGLTQSGDQLEKTESYPLTLIQSRHGRQGLPT